MLLVGLIHLTLILVSESEQWARLQASGETYLNIAAKDHLSNRILEIGPFSFDLRNEPRAEIVKTFVDVTRSGPGDRNTGAVIDFGGLTIQVSLPRSSRAADMPSLLRAALSAAFPSATAPEYVVFGLIVAPGSSTLIQQLDNFRALAGGLSDGPQYLQILPTTAIGSSGISYVAHVTGGRIVGIATFEPPRGSGRWIGTLIVHYPGEQVEFTLSDTDADQKVLSRRLFLRADEFRRVLSKTKR